MDHQQDQYLWAAVAAVFLAVLALSLCSAGCSVGVAVEGDYGDWQQVWQGEDEGATEDVDAD